MTGFAIAVDIGGTFTDVVLRHRDGRFWVDKTLTTTGDLQEGFFKAIDGVLERAGHRPEEVDEFVVHATTVVTNAIIERKGPSTALLVTEGFRDVLFIRDENRSDVFDNQIEAPQPLVPHELTFGVPERVLADGSVDREVDEASVRSIAGQLRAAGIRSAAICFLNAYRNPDNERRVRDILADEMPELYVSLSADIAPQMREYPRASTTVLNAYTMPIVEPYLRTLTRRLRDSGFRQDLLIMLSSGGVISAEVAARNPVRMIESGPAAGALAATFYSRLLGLENLLSFDMGGTTAKACFIQDGQPLVTGTFEVDRIYRFQAGSGMPVTVPCIDMIEIGAGGGSIAAVDSLRLLTVGPRSAGSNPGPVCYGRGGEEPTVTDADLALGMLDAENFLGGEMALDADAMRGALTRLGEALGTDAEEAAVGIYEMVGESMAAAVRTHATDRGVDWRGIPLLAFGGAGPVHACYVAELLESTTVIYPPMASVLSAFGTLVTPVRLDLVRSDLRRVGSIDWSVVGARLDEMRAEGREALEKAGCPGDAVSLSISCDMRYQGQHNEITVAIPVDVIDVHDEAAMRRTFERDYEHNYGVRLEDLPVEVVSWRVSVNGPAVTDGAPQTMAAAGTTRTSHRRVRYPGGAFETPVYARTDLGPGTRIEGPAIIEERETTIVILPRWRAEVDAHGCIFATREV